MMRMTMAIGLSRTAGGRTSFLKKSSKKRLLAGARLIRRGRGLHLMRDFCVLPIAAMLAGCASNPDQSIYVMPAADSAKDGPQAASGGLGLKLRPVILPDYLDTTDLVTRTGEFKIEASRTGRWGERLSEGVTRTLAADLAKRLQAHVVTVGPTEPPPLQIEVRVNAFDVTKAASVLAASWTAVRQGGGSLPVTGHGTFSTSIAQPGGDLAVVTAMAETVAELSDGIAATARAEGLEVASQDKGK
jgi:uncharacterized lipoprotein YmbA